MKTSTKAVATCVVLALATMSGCNRGKKHIAHHAESTSTSASTQSILKATSEPAQVVRKYMLDAEKQNSSTTRPLSVEVSNDGYLKECRPLDHSGWVYDEESTTLLREAVSADGDFAIVTAALTFKSRGQHKLKMTTHTEFYLTHEDGTWKIMQAKRATQPRRTDQKPQGKTSQEDLSQSNTSAMVDAVTEGNIELVRLYIGMGADVKAKDSNSETVLMKAAKSGNEMIARMLIERGADVNTENTYGATALMVAVSNKKESMAQLLITKGADVRTSKMRDGSTALIIAVRKKLGEELVRLLIAKGADVNARALSTPNDEGKASYTALMYASNNGSEPLVRLLLDSQADVNAKTDQGDTPLLLAVTQGHEKIANWLIEKGADVSAKNTSEECPLEQAIGQLVFETGGEEYRGNCKFARLSRLLIEKGADPKALVSHCNQRTTLLQKAISNGFYDIACMLIAKGADLTVKNEIGNTLLIETAFYNQLPVAKALIEAGADVMAKNDRGYTALRMALGGAHNEIAHLLLKHGAKPSSKQEESWMAHMRNFSTDQ